MWACSLIHLLVHVFISLGHVNSITSILIDQMDLGHVDIPMNIILFFCVDDIISVRLNKREVAHTLETWVRHTYILQRLCDKTYEVLGGLPHQ